MEIIEGVIIIVIIAIQLLIAYRLKLKISEYCDIYNIESLPSVKHCFITKHDFESVDSSNISVVLQRGSSESELVDNVEYIEIVCLEDKKGNEILSTIIKYINVYLIKNKGVTVDFHIIKDIVDKHTETLETQIENRVPAPLYLGLAATMLGIIVGLFSVKFTGSADALDAIQPLINGVKWAMSASVIGLIITTIFSIKLYKDAQIEVDEEKNEFLSKLQSELMPKMSRGKLPEVSILSEKLDVFARNTAGAVSQLDKIVQTSSAAIAQEQAILSEIRAIDIKKVTSANITVFSKLDEMMDSFDTFAKYYEELDKSMLSTTELLSNLKQFVNNTQNVNIILEEIKSIVRQSSEATDFFNKHIQSFEKYNESVNNAVATNDLAFRNAIKQLTLSTQNQIESFNTLVANYDTKLSNAFTQSVDKFTQTMDAQVQRTEQAFIDGRPKFEMLNELVKLGKLDGIDSRLKSLEDHVINGNKAIIIELKNINSSISNKRSSEGYSPNNIEIVDAKGTDFFSRNLSVFMNTLKIVMYISITVYAVISMLKNFNVL